MATVPLDKDKIKYNAAKRGSAKLCLNSMWGKLGELNLRTQTTLIFNPLPVQFKALLHGQKGCVFFSGHLNLRTTPETGQIGRASCRERV